MIRNIKYFIVVLIAFTSFSCKRYFELLPTNGLTKQEFWKTKEDVEAMLMAAYETFANMDGNLFLYGDIRADMLAGDNNQGKNEQLIMESNIYPDNKFCDWSDFYQVINMANEVIKNAPLVQKIDHTFTDFQMQGMVSEASFIRSLAYFYLVRIYKEVPLILEPTESDNTDFYVTKTSEDVILDQITKDLEAQRSFAPSGGFQTVEENKGRASKAAFDALLADIALWRFNYEKVIEYVERIENTGVYFLMPSGNWFDNYYPGNTLESIFEFQFNGNLGQNNSTYDLTDHNTNQYIPSQRALEMFAFDYNSKELVRGQNATIKKYGADDYIIWKYIGQAPDGLSFRSGADANSCNWIVYRYADVLLMKAEALSQLGRYPEAYDIIDRIRARAGVPSIVIANTPNAYEDAILNERARELAYEGKRWFDILRMGRRNNYTRKSKLIDIVIANAASTQKRILAVKLTNPLGWYLPIYSKEIENNKNLVQNPFYVF